MFCVVAFSACSAGDASSESGNLPVITVSIPPLAYFAEAIGGDSVEVQTLMPAGTDPETFEPGVGVMRALAVSGALALTGTLPFEDALLGNIQANNGLLKTYSMAEGIYLIHGTHRHDHGDADGLRHHHDDEGDVDPHIWSSVKNARIIASNMLGALIDVAPEHKDYFTGRHDALVQHLDSLDGAFASRIAASGAKSFLIWHPSLSYFARDYGLSQIAFNVENKETSPLQLQSSLRRAAEMTPAAFFIAEGTDGRRTAAIASETGLEPVPVNLMSAQWETPLQVVTDALCGKK